MRQGRLAIRPDFVVETAEAKLLCEPKRASELETGTVLLKREAAVEWCRHATEYERESGGMPWHYVLMPHDAVTSTATLQGLAGPLRAAVRLPVSTGRRIRA
jgi:type III restriction enzyme